MVHSSVEVTSACFSDVLVCGRTVTDGADEMKEEVLSLPSCINSTVFLIRWTVHPAQWSMSQRPPVLFLSLQETQLILPAQSILMFQPQTHMTRHLFLFQLLQHWLTQRNQWEQEEEERCLLTFPVNTQVKSNVLLVKKTLTWFSCWLPTVRSNCVRLYRSCDLWQLWLNYNSVF